MKKILAGLLLAAAWGIPAHADVRVVTACGSTSPFPAPAVGSSFQFFYIDTTGDLCSSGSGGGGGGSTYGAALPSTGTAIGVQYLSGSESVSNGNMYPLLVDSSGSLKVDVVTGGAVGSTYGAALPATGTAIGAQYLSGSETVANGNMYPFLVDSNGSLKVNVVTSVSNISQFGGSNVVTGAGVGGAGIPRVTVSSDSFPLGAAQADAAALAVTVNPAGSLGTLISGPPNLNVNGTNEPLTGLIPGTAQTGTVYAANSDTTSIGGTAVLRGAGATGTGAQRVTVAQDATTIAGAPPGRIWNYIAASSTAYVLSSTQGGATGATGDYLSHCVVSPGTTSPGTVAIFDGTNGGSTIFYQFAGGASSVTSLAPWSVPVGAVSATGAWKVTTTTNVTVSCSGKFT